MGFENLTTPQDLPKSPLQQQISNEPPPGVSQKDWDYIQAVNNPQAPTQQVMNPDTGEIRNINPSQMSDYAAQGFTTSPSIEQMREAGVLNHEGQLQKMSERTFFIPSIAAKDVPMTADGNIDIGKSIDMWGDSTARVLEKVVSDQDKPKVREIVEQIRKPSGQYVWNPETEEIRLVKSPGEAAKLFEEGWKSPDTAQLKQQGFLDEKGRATYDLRKVSSMATKPTDDEARALKMGHEAAKKELQAEQLIKQTSGQYVWNPETEEIRLVKNTEDVAKLLDEGWKSPGIDKLKQQGIVDEKGNAYFDITTSAEFKWKPSDDTLRGIRAIEKYGDPVTALANGISEKDIRAAGYDIESVDKTLGKSIRAWFNELPDDDKSIIKKDGLSAYQKIQDDRQKDFEQTHVQDKKTGEWYEKDWYNNIADDNGNKVDIISQGVTNTTGSSREDVIKAYEEMFKVGGMENVLKHLEDVEVNKTNLLKKYEIKEPFIGPVDKNKERPDIVVGYDTNKLAEDFIEQGVVPDKAAAKIESLGFTSKDADYAVKYATATPEGKFKILQEQGLIPEGATYGGIKDGQVVYYPEGTKPPSLSDIDITSLDDQSVRELYKQEFPKHPVPAMPIPTPDKSWSDKDYVNQMRQELFKKQDRFGKAFTSVMPIIGTKRSIEERGFKSGWTILSIATDALLLAGALKGASSGARAFAYPSRIGRIGAAAEGAAESIVPKIPSLSDIKAMATGFKNIFRIKHIPLPALETSSSVPKLPISVAGSAEEAMAIRDTLMARVAAGLKPEVTINGVKYTLDTPLIKGLTHTGPDVAWLKAPDGAVVKVKFKPGTNIPQPEGEQGLFLGSGTHSRFADSSAFGMKGNKPGVAIFTKSGQKAISSGKTYIGTVEMERKFPVGTNLPKLKSSGVSVTAAGLEFEILTEASIPLKTRSMARLGQPIIEARSIVTPAIKVSGKKVPNVDLLEEARMYDEAAEKAISTGDNTLALKLKNEATELRYDRMYRPQTPQSAGQLSRYFYDSAASIERGLVNRPDNINKTDATQLRAAIEQLRDAGQMMNRIATNALLRNAYNERVSNIRAQIDTDQTRPKTSIRRIVEPTIDRIIINRDGEENARVENITDNRDGTPDRVNTKIVTTDRTPIERTDISRIAIVNPERVVSERVASIITDARIPRVVASESPLPKAPIILAKPKISIKEVKGIPDNPGVVVWRQGIVYITIKPPYRPGTADVEYTTKPPSDMPTKGVPKVTIKTRGGNAPAHIKLDMGVVDAVITKGKRITYPPVRDIPAARLSNRRSSMTGAFEVHRSGDVVLTRRRQRGRVVGINKDGLRIIKNHRRRS